MKIKFDHKLRETYLPPRCRKYRTREIDVPITLALKEISAEEAPVAMTTTTLEWRKVDGGIGRDGTDLIPVPTDYRWFKNKLYTPYKDRDGELKTAEDIVRSISVYAYWNYTKEELMKMLRKSLKAFIIIDGIIHEIAGEPRYVINTFGLGRNHGGTGFFVENFYNSNIRKDNYFNALQRDAAIAYGKHIASGRGDTKSVDGIGSSCDIKVFIPEAVKCNPNKEHGNGCSLINSLETLVNAADSTIEAGLMVMAFTSKQIIEAK